MTRIDELAEAIAGNLARRGFVHDDPRAYRAGVNDAMAAIRAAVAEQERQQRAAAAATPPVSAGTTAIA